VVYITDIPETVELINVFGGLCGEYVTAVMEEISGDGFAMVSTCIGCAPALGRACCYHLRQARLIYCARAQGRA
jgi:hypothetical protein